MKIIWLFFLNTFQLLVMFYLLKFVVFFFFFFWATQSIWESFPVLGVLGIEPGPPTFTAYVPAFWATAPGPTCSWPDSVSHCTWSPENRQAWLFEYRAKKNPWAQLGMPQIPPPNPQIKMRNIKMVCNLVYFLSRLHRELYFENLMSCHSIELLRVLWHGTTFHTVF